MRDQLRPLHLQQDLDDDDPDSYFLAPCKDPILLQCREGGAAGWTLDVAPPEPGAAAAVRERRLQAARKAAEVPPPQGAAGDAKGSAGGSAKAQRERKQTRKKPSAPAKTTGAAVIAAAAKAKEREDRAARRARDTGEENLEPPLGAKKTKASVHHGVPVDPPPPVTLAPQPQPQRQPQPSMSLAPNAMLPPLLLPQPHISGGVPPRAGAGGAVESAVGIHAMSPVFQQPSDMNLALILNWTAQQTLDYDARVAAERAAMQNRAIGFALACMGGRAGNASMPSQSLNNPGGLGPM